jgi:chemotaxis family two-component system response regulator Rcp1
MYGSFINILQHQVLNTNHMKISTKQLRIFVADDDVEDVQLLKNCLSDNNVSADVSAAEDGKELLDRLRMDSDTGKRKPHLIMLDINMSRKNGFETLQELKQDKELCTIPVVIFSTSDEQRDVRKAYELGANCYISKPHSAVEWMSTIGMLGHFWSECAALVH